MNAKSNHRIEITPSPIPLDRIMAELSGPEHGAQLVFTGAVRNRNHGKQVLSVSYDLFAPLATATFTEICDETQAKWGPDLRITLVHRTGRLEIGELSVVIAVASAHRAEAYEASRYLIENLKHRAPIWKKETYLDGESGWLQGHALCQHSQTATL